MAVIPIMIDLKAKNVVIVGGGYVARRRLVTLLECEAELTVISPEILPEINDFVIEGKVNWKQKKVASEDLREAFFIVIATNEKRVNEFVRRNAPPHSLINASDDAQGGNVHFPSYFKRGRLNIAVSTNGASPKLAKKVKQELASHYNEDFEKYVDFLFEARVLLKKSRLSKQEREQYLDEFLSDDYKLPSIQKKTLQKLREISRH